MQVNVFSASKFKEGVCKIKHSLVLEREREREREKEAFSLLYQQLFLPTKYLLGRAIAQAVSRWLPTAAARVRTPV
jgi:hypothetical protein